MKTPVIRFAVHAGCAALIACAAAAFAAEEPPSAEALYTSGRAAFQQGDYKTALKQFRSLEKEHPKAPQAVRGLEYIAQCENNLGDPYAAFEAYQKIWDEHKNFDKLPVITRNQMRIGNHFLKTKSYNQAIEVYQKILLNAPYSEYAAAAQYSLAQAYIGDEDYDSAKEELRKVIQKYQTSQLIDDAAFDLGYVDYLVSRDMEYDQTATTDAIASFRKFIHEFPSSPKVPEARGYIAELRDRKAASLFRMATFYENIRAPRAAEIAFKEVIEQYPDTTYAGQARTHLGNITAIGDAEPVTVEQAGTIAQLETVRADVTVREAAEKAKLARQTELEKPLSPTPAEATAYAPVPPPPVPTPSAREAERKRTMSNARVRELVSTPAGQADLKKQMKEIYIEEAKRKKATRIAWQQQQAEAARSPKAARAASGVSVPEPAVGSLEPERKERTATAASGVRVGYAPQAAQAEPVTGLALSETPAPAPAQRAAPVPAPLPVQSPAAPATVASESRSYEFEPETPVTRAAQPAPAAVVAQPAAIETPAPSGPVAVVEQPATRAAVAQSAQRAPAAAAASDSTVFTNLSPSEAEALRRLDVFLNKANIPEQAAAPRDAVISTFTPTSPAPQPVAAATPVASPAAAATPVTRTASADGLTVAIGGAEKPAAATPAVPAAPATPAVSATPVAPATPVSVGTIGTGRPRTTVSSSSTASSSAEQTIAITPKVQAAAVKPAEETISAMATEAASTVKQQTKAAQEDVRVQEELAAQQAREQQRAIETRQLRDAAVMQSESSEGQWRARVIPSPGTVRRAEMDEKAAAQQSAVDEDTLRKEFASAYYSVQRGDAARQQGLQNIAKEHYGAALDRLLALQKKAPGWETDVVSFRIDYCRRLLRSAE